MTEVEGVSFTSAQPPGSVKEVIQTAREINGHPIPCVTSERRPGDTAELVAGSDKIRRELGWSPAYPDSWTSGAYRRK